MHTILSISSPFDSRAERLYNLLSQFRQTLYVDSNKFLSTSDTTHYLILNGVRPIATQDAHTVLFVAGGEVPIKCPKSVKCAVTCNADERELYALQRLKLPVVSCGLSAKDTVSVSSVNKDGVSVSVQRKIRTVNGKIVEPREISVQGTEIDAQMVACMVAIMLLFDDCDEFIT